MAKLNSTEWGLASRPEGMPKPSDFAKKTVEIAEPKDGEIQVQNEWMSVDPYMLGLPSPKPQWSRNCRT